jgi:ribosomal protein S18 acetylase RimI-like enzyme
MNESNFLDAVNFIARMQVAKQHHIGYFGMEVDELFTYIQELEPEWQETALLAYEEEKLVGLIVAEYDTELNRAWIHGPIVDHQKWHSVADTLFNGLITQIIPAPIKDLELFGDRKNLNLKEFAERHGFSSTDPALVLSFPRCKLDSLPEIKGKKITEQYFEAFELLHANIFPQTYYSGNQILNMLDTNNQLFIETENSILLGFIHGKLEESNQEGYIEFVGVKESLRQRGLGKKLVMATLHWLFHSFPQINEVTLTVSENNVPAVKLYTNLGFDQIRSLQGYRKKDGK